MPTEPFPTFPIWDQRQFAVESSRCVVLMPFDDSPLKRVFREAIAPAVSAAGLEPVRADRSAQPKIVEYIWTLLNESRIVIAEVSGSNPNVLYELGIAHTIGKPTVILRSNSDSDVPFDVRHLRSIKYASSEPDLVELKAEILAALEALMAAHPTGYRLLDELESAARQWRGPSRDFGLLYPPERLVLIQRFVLPSALSDAALAFCAASACQWGSASHMVHWGSLCNGRPEAAVDLGFGIFNHQRRPRLRIAYLLCQFDNGVRTLVLAKLAEHGLKGQIVEAIRQGSVSRYATEHSQELGLNQGEVQELADLFHNSQLVFSRPMP